MKKSCDVRGQMFGVSGIDTTPGMEVTEWVEVCHCGIQVFWSDPQNKAYLMGEVGCIFIWEVEELCVQNS